jgi:drug/metabolite transporter (DMT)-like permease
MASVTTADLPPGSRPLSLFAIGIMTVLCFSWGFNQVAVKLAMPDIPPLMQASLRSFGALAVVAFIAKLRGIALFRRDGTLLVGILLGVLFACEFIFVYRGLLWTSASRAVMFLYTAPFFVALGAVLFLAERLSVVQWGGLALSFFGLVVAFGAPQTGVDAATLFGDGMMIFGAMFWAATTLLFKASKLARVPAEKAMAYQVAVSGPILALAAWLFGETMPAMPALLPLASLAYQTFWVVGCTFLIWYMLMGTYAASKLSAFTFVTPLFGVAAGHLVLGEPISLGFAVAVAFVVLGLILVNRRPAGAR